MDIEPPTDTQALYDKLKADEMLQTPDMSVQGDWTYHQWANFMTAREFVEGAEMDWDSIRAEDWIDAGPAASMEGLIDIGNPTSRDSSFGAGDPGIGVSAGNGYNILGRSGSASALEMGGSKVVSADRGERAVAFNAPNNADLVQLIVQFGWGYQMSAVAAILKTLPSIGNQSTWKVPAYNTADGRRNFLSAYSYSYSGALLGVPAFQTTFNINVANATPIRFTVTDADGEAATSTDVDVEPGGESVSVTWVNTPGTGNIVLDAGGTPYTIGSTEVTPPPL